MASTAAHLYFDARAKAYERALADHFARSARLEERIRKVGRKRRPR